MLGIKLRGASSSDILFFVAERRAERALARYYTAFENGELDATRFETRVSAFEARLDSIREQDVDLTQQLAPEAATSPDAAELAAVADNLETTIAAAEPRQAKALLRLLIKDLRVNARSEILPTYRIVTPTVCALPSSVERTGIEPVTSGLQAARAGRRPKAGDDERRRNRRNRAGLRDAGCVTEPNAD